MLLKDNYTYDRVEILEGYPVPIYVFYNVEMNKGQDRFLHLEGTWATFPEGGLNYGHFIKECLGSFLYIKKIYPEVNPIFLNLFEGANTLKTQNTRHILKYVRQKILLEHDKFFEINGYDYYHRHVQIDKLVIMMDNGKLFVKDEHPFFNDVEADHLIDGILDFFSYLIYKDETMPKKVFISRKEVSKDLLEKNIHTLPYYKTRYFENWVEDSIEQVFKDNGYKIIDVNGMTLEEQISYFHNATHIAGIIGCAFVNTMFIQDGIEIFGIRPNNLYLAPWDSDVKIKYPNTKFEHIDLWSCKNSEEIYNTIKEKIQ